MRSVPSPQYSAPCDTAIGAHAGQAVPASDTDCFHSTFEVQRSMFDVRVFDPVDRRGTWKRTSNVCVAVAGSARVDVKS
jgi:hypothetical protein